MITVTDWLGEQATYAYDQDGRLSSFTQFNGIVTAYSYDAASRLTSMGSAAASYQFTLDGDGNRINSIENQPLSATATNGVSAVYTYNTQKDRLLSAGPLSYAYDNEGQLVSSGGTCLTFDYNHRLVEIGGDTQFSYDGRGNRISATRSEVTTTYIYDPSGNLIADADSNGVTHKYIYGKGLLAMATSSARYCYHFNGTGSTVAVTDMNQNIVNSYAYDPFGQILGQQETVPQPFKYVGQYGVMAEPNGLYYMRARYYDPNVGRFISEDPLGFGGGDVNLYAYVKNNPVNRADPFGLDGDVIGGLPSAWPVVVGAGQAFAKAVAGAVSGSVVVGAVVVGGVIVGTPSSIAEEPAVPSSAERNSVGDSCDKNDDLNDHCQEHFQRCLMTSLADEPGSTYGQSRCGFCREVCMRDGGWPSSAPTTRGWVTCNYGLFPQSY
ncbi:MAG: RHS repeat domain-containing protein [Syntrophobacteraceae bacterium]